MSDGRKRYRRGAEAERLCGKILERAGYWVIRAAGSRGVVDLVALRPGRVLGIQVKRGRSPWPPPHELLEWEAKAGGKGILAVYLGHRGWIFCRPTRQGWEQFEPIWAKEVKQCVAG